MAYFYIRLCVLLFIAGWSGVQAQNSCPAECQCIGGEAVCSGVQGIISSPFPDSVVNVTIGKLSKLSALGPSLFGKYTENILVETSTIEDISPHAFSNMQSVKSIRFHSVFITKIRSCAFNFIQSPAVIEFREANIVTAIEPGAISNMPGLEEVSFVHSTITNIASHAFLNIRVRNFTIFDTEIAMLATASMNSIQDVDVFQFLKVTIATFKAGAFSNLTMIHNARVDMCHFVELQCNSLMELREATPGDHDTFIFTNSSLVCNCSVVDMLEYARANPNALTNSVVCARTPQHQALKSLQIRDICPNLGIPRCSIVDSIPPTCTADMTQMTTRSSSSRPSSSTSTSIKTTRLTAVTTPKPTNPGNVDTESITPGNKTPGLLTLGDDVFVLLIISGFIAVLL